MYVYNCHIPYTVSDRDGSIKEESSGGGHVVFVGELTMDAHVQGGGSRAESEHVSGLEKVSKVKRSKGREVQVLYC